VFDTVRLADQIEPHFAECDAVTVPGLFSEVDAIICKNGVYPVRHRLQQMLQELPGCFAIGFLDQLGDRELAGPVNGDKEIKLAFLGPDFSNVDMEISDRVTLELLALRFVAFNVRQTRYPMPLKAAMQ